MSTTITFPQGEISEILGTCIVLTGNDIDTDRIIPARFLKCINFQNLGDQVFADDRTELQGKHPFDLSVNQGSSILIVNENFGCGSSREHAPQALMRWGIRAILGQSFAEIFYGNCLALGIPCATASIDQINDLQSNIENNPKSIFKLSLHEQLIKTNSQVWTVKFEPGPLNMLTSGNWDGTSELINRNKELRNTIKKLPYLNQFSI